MRPRRLALVACLLGLCAARGDAPRPAPLTLAVIGLAQDFLEPCGCGGANAGGLARRSAIVASLRTAYPDLLVLDLGGFGVHPQRVPIAVRASARLGAIASGMSSDDLANADLLAAAEIAGLPLVSAVPPKQGEVPRALGAGRLGVTSVAWRELPLRAMVAAAGREMAELRAGGVDVVALISHLGLAGTRQLVEQLDPAVRPDMVLLADSSDDSQPTFTELGLVWIPVARKARSVSLVTVAWPGDRPQIGSEQRMVLPGPKDETVQAWVDDYYARERAGQVGAVVELPLEPPTPVSACESCHAAAAAAWRRHKHAAAVGTLEALGRDVANCLRCHSEWTRAQGLRPPADGDRGVTCVTCHTDSKAHLAQAGRLPVPLGEATCVGCHTPENSPRWEFEAYRDHVAAFCRGEVRPPLAADSGEVR